MAIAAAKQTSPTSVEVYNERGSLMFTKSGTLVGFTPTTVSINVHGAMNVYDERGTLKFTK